ncbi:hypothetical protein SPBR_08321 [Sporothrix brasiliensis 5110]|uniref:Major facilitator superfamily (MFS) profile domain-containing protein n=1 Tax=Sporothrix brasiliensis 5110 TaxID=1398154 RepID=A0A0C2INN5_9PEZI|nr:uncharacterized protein SPBR_08321 [Sporothrix brasiliensis 5110]KIH86632.1 hypothetical protein SPBR_08321 [Sporothrix brasiliensis 5110]
MSDHSNKDAVAVLEEIDNVATQTSNVEEKGVVEDTEASHRPRLSDIRFILLLVGFGMAFIGSQVQPLVFSSIVPEIAASLNSHDLLIWFFCTPYVAIGVIAPFIGPLADLLGRKPIALAGVLSSMVGMIVAAATPTAAGYLAGMVLTGIGIAAEELMAITAIVEIVPTRYRGYYVAIMVACFLPFAPGSLYGVLLAQYSWRYCACFVALWNFVTAILIFCFYNPPPRTNAAGMTTADKIKHIDFVGGLLMTAGLVMFLVGFNWGGQQYPWHAARVIAFLTIGSALIVIFCLYEAYGAPYPMFPRRLMRHTRTFIALMVVITMAGINYIPVLFFWVLQAVAVYDSDRIELGIRTLPFGFCILGGALISAVIVSRFKSHLRLIMSTFCIVQVVAIGSMAAADPYNINTIWAPLVLGLLGVGGVLIPNQIIITVICPDDLIATATSLTVCLRAVGQVVGLSTFYTQFVSVLTARTLKLVIPVAINAGIFDIPTLQNMMPTLVSMPYKLWAPTISALDTPDKIDTLHHAVVDAFGGAFPRVYFISIAFGVTAVIASFFIESLGKLMDEHIAVPYF